MHETSVGSRAGRTDELLERSAALGGSQSSWTRSRRPAAGASWSSRERRGSASSHCCAASGPSTQSNRVSSGCVRPPLHPAAARPVLGRRRTGGGGLRGPRSRRSEPYGIAGALLQELSRRPTVPGPRGSSLGGRGLARCGPALTHRIGTVPTLVVGSYRDDDVPRGHPFRTVLEKLGREGRSPGCGSTGFGGPVSQLAGPHPVDPVELYRTTGGNPFFVTEALAASEGNPRDGSGCGAGAREPPAAVGADLLEAVAIGSQPTESRMLELAPSDMGELDASNPDS